MMPPSWAFELVGQIDGMAYDLHIDGPLAYVGLRRQSLTDQSTELVVFNLADPIRPRRLGALVLPQLHYFCIAGRYAYATTIDSFHIVDLADPQQPLAVGRYGFNPLRQMPARVAVRGSHAFVAASDAGMVVFNVANPQAPQVVGNYPPPREREVIGGHVFHSIGRIWHLTVADSYAYVNALGLRVLDIADPTQPREIGHLDMPWLQGMKIKGPFLYVSTGVHPGCPAQLHILDITDPGHPREVGTYATEATVNDITTVGRYALAVRGENVIEDTLTLPGELLVLDLEDPAYPLSIASYPIPAWRIALAHGYVYLAGEDGLRIFASTALDECSNV
jgi:hypothetical protein